MVRTRSLRWAINLPLCSLEEKGEEKVEVEEDEKSKVGNWVLGTSRRFLPLIANTPPSFIRARRDHARQARLEWKLQNVSGKEFLASSSAPNQCHQRHQCQRCQHLKASARDAKCSAQLEDKSATEARDSLHAIAHSPLVAGDHDCWKSQFCSLCLFYLATIFSARHLPAYFWR